eukprot:TRINITY_DN2484_c0_g1_i1.p1 TRINITY_DN2484_c0_g1~~TRINITY_DN2484_c0_g1_i1.p1  ORF type:complete len:396 (-),score=30.00 TRINITY_DN2484_c0_g1_i1:279-1466(-)
MDCNSKSTNIDATIERKLEINHLSHISMLPSEMLVHIFSKMWGSSEGEEEYLYFTHLMHISLVCKRWNELCQEPLLWKYYSIELNEGEFPQISRKLLNPNFQKLLNPKFSRINTLKFVGCKPRLLPPHYVHIFFGCQGCSQCSPLVRYIEENERFKFNLTQIHKSLTELEFINYIIDDKVFRSIRNLPSLQNLYIFASHFRPNTSFQYITQVTQLKHLTFEFNDHENFPDNLLLSFSQLSNLERLEVIDIPSSENISHLSKLIKLRDLRFRGFTMIDQHFSEGLSTLTQIKTLLFENGLGDFEHTLTQPLPNLTSLYIRANITCDEFILFLTPFLPSLRKIYFEGAIQTVLSRKHIEEIISLAPHIKKVSLICKGITQNVLGELNRVYEGRILFK